MEPILQNIDGLFEEVYSRWTTYSSFFKIQTILLDMNILVYVGGIGF